MANRSNNEEDVLLKSSTIRSYNSNESPAFEDEPKEAWYRYVWRKERLLVFILVGIIAGTICGVLSNAAIQRMDEPCKSNVVLLLGFPGELFLRSLQLLILPLITASIIVGLANLDSQQSSRIGRRTLVYYFVTTLCAILTGLCLALTIKPGSTGDKTPGENVSSASKDDVRTMDSVLDILRNMFSDNLVDSYINHVQTIVKEVNVNNSTNITTFVADRVIRKKGANVLGYVVFSVVFGMALNSLAEVSRPIYDWIASLNEVVMKLVNWIMFLSPIGIGSLVCGQFVSVEDLSQTFSSLGLYTITVLAGLFIHVCITLPAIYAIIKRSNPFRLVKGCSAALLTAVGTSSSSATLPTTIKSLESKVGVDRRITRFVLPIGATVNMDGTALYEAVAAIFVAQTYGTSMDFGQCAVVALISMLTSVGAAGIPNAGMVTLLLVLQTVGLPREGVALIIPVDWLLDRIRTTVNVFGDCVGACVVEHLSQEDLKDDHTGGGVDNPAFVES